MYEDIKLNSNTTKGKTLCNKNAYLKTHTM